VNAELVAAIEDAISKVLAEHGHMVEGWIGFVNLIDQDGDRCWEAVAPPEQSFDLGLSMALWLYEMQVEVLRCNVRDHLRGLRDDG
jgi:hypothetical protein